MKQQIRYLFLLLPILSILLSSQSSWPVENLPTPLTKSKCTTQLTIEGTIGPATFDYLETGIQKATENKCDSVLLLINTPGGSLQSTRLIVEKIINSPLPILCLVAPSGGHAGSAGAIILQACHVAGAIYATNIGAATPVLPTGGDISKDMRNKMINDTVSWVLGLVKLRGRNQKFGRDIVESAKAVDAESAAKIGAIDKVAATVEEFMLFARGQSTELAGGKKTIVKTGPIKPFAPNLRYRVLETVTDPQFAYFIFMGSLGLIYFEITHPGLMVPGVVGTIGIVVSMMSFHKLNVWWGGIALLLLGIVLMIAEAFVPSFGALGIGGMVSFVLGSVFLFDPLETGYSLSLSMILPTAIGLGLLMLGLAYMAFKTRHIKKHGGYDDLIGAKARVVSLKGAGNNGQVEVLGEIWKFTSSENLKVNQNVIVKNHEGLTLTVESQKES